LGPCQPYRLVIWKLMFVHEFLLEWKKRINALYSVVSVIIAFIYFLCLFRS